MNHKSFIADVSMLGIAIIWGFTFPMVKDAVTGFPVYSFLALRFALASIALLALTWRLLRTVPLKWAVFALGAGLVNFAGFALQTFGLQTISPGRAAFITGLYGAIVPFMLAFMGRGRITRPVWVAIMLSVLGLTCLFWQDLTLSIASGDALVMLCAVAFALQIVMVGQFPKSIDPRPLATLQSIACFGGAAVFAMINDGVLVSPPALPMNTLGAAAFTAIFATALALLVQTWAQRHTPTSHAALIFCTEPVWGALAGLTLFGEVFTPLAVLGCTFMLLGMMMPDLSGIVREALQRRALRPQSQPAAPPFGLPAR
ncbi:MAG: DMT family transporter [Anaerolineae bacterium]|nr:DMT family transporter [Thermoflexales bacterium]MDW8406366.1 DMT family transporter [Anaerolineae bacterium]